MSITAEVIKNQFSDLITELFGDSKTPVTKVCPVEKGEDQAIVFAANPKQMTQALEGNAPIIVTHEKYKDLAAGSPKTILFTKNPAVAMALVTEKFFWKPPTAITGEPFIHGSAVVNSTANIGDSVRIEAGAVIGEHVVIGDRVYIGPNSVIEAHAQIGSDTWIGPLVVIGYNCIVGNKCRIYSHTNIGKDGFGFSQDHLGNHYRLPQLGIVRLGDNVEVGSSCTIDRAMFDETVIRDGTKLDNHCHIAHNCSVGENGMITAGIIVAGSTNIGKNFLTGGGVRITDHVNIADNVQLGGMSGVGKDISEPGAYAGYPLQKFKDNMRTLATLWHLVEIRKNVDHIVKKLGIEK